MDAILNRRANRLASLSLLMLLAASVWAQTPTLARNSANGSFSNVTGSTNGTFSSYLIPLPNPAGAGNAIALAVRGISTNSSAISITDNEGTNTYTTQKCETDSNTLYICEYLALNVAAGTQFITVNFSPDDRYLMVEATEIYNVAASSAIDGSANGATGSMTGGTAATATAGSTGTLSDSGDYIYMACEAGTGPFTWTAGSGQPNITWGGIDFNTQDGFAQQGGVYGSTAAITPQLTVESATSTSWGCVAMALKAASAGTAPSATAIRVNNVQHTAECVGADNSSCASSPTTIIYDFPSSGNLLLYDYHTGPSYQAITGITDSNNNSWQRQCSWGGSGNYDYERWYVPATAVTSANLVVTITLNSNTQDGGAGAFYDISNGGAPDTSFGTSGCYLVQSNLSNAPPTTWTPTTTLVPEQSNELFLTGVLNANQTVGSITSPMGATLISGYASPIPEFIHYDQNNGFGSYLAPNTNAQTWTWGFIVNAGSSGTAIGNVDFVASAFKQATGSGGSGSCGPLMLLHAGCLLDAKLSDHQ